MFDVTAGLIWTPFLAVFAVFVIAFASSFRFNREQFLLFAVTENDDDMKIVGGGSISDPTPEDAAEAAAKQFLLHKSTGNIDKARTLGIDYAHTILEFANKTPCPELTESEIHHQILLCSYVVNRVIADKSPDSILAQTTLNVFYDEIEASSLELHRHINDTAAFSLYILSDRSGEGDSAEIGEIYAGLCGFEKDQDKMKAGSQVFESFYRVCADMMQNARYQPV
jgi:hypothetical protein